MRLCLIILFLLQLSCFSQSANYYAAKEFSLKYGSINPEINLAFDLTFAKGYDKSRPVFLHVGADSCEISFDTLNGLYGVFTDISSDTTIKDVMLSAYLCAPVYIDSLILKKNQFTVINAVLEGATIILPNIEYDFDKPVVYLHSDEEISVSIHLDFVESLTFSYPDYQDAWNVDVCGNQIKHNNRTYPYLFYEGKSEEIAKYVNLDSGFIVNSSNLPEFLDSCLLQMGFNVFERNDFISYWIPRMQANSRNYISFITHGYNELFPISVSPQPHAMLRVFMLWSKVPVNSSLAPIPQTFRRFKGGAYTLKEWGGSEINIESHINTF